MKGMKPIGDTSRICLVRNVTERRNTEAMLQSEDGGHRTPCRWGAHDMNNAFNVILSSVYSLRGKLAGLPAQTEELDDVSEICDWGAELTWNLLGFARKGSCSEKVFCMNSVVRRLAELLERTAPKNIRVGLVLDDNHCPVRSDLGQVENALVNVCLNGWMP